uniref:Ovule protein n=1 Tax=Rhabditophanes sp. KR3021 TaxID=114890 RepID=A0AC35TRH2_9BILA
LIPLIEVFINSSCSSVNSSVPDRTKIVNQNFSAKTLIDKCKGATKILSGSTIDRKSYVTFDKPSLSLTRTLSSRGVASRS